MILFLSGENCKNNISGINIIKSCTRKNVVSVRIISLTMNVSTLNMRNLYKKLDFMGHRDLLSYLLDKNILKGKNIVCPKYQPNIMKVFCQFILDRNKYTHGRLIYVPSLKRTCFTVYGRSRKSYRNC